MSPQRPVIPNQNAMKTRLDLARADEADVVADADAAAMNPLAAMRKSRASIPMTLSMISTMALASCPRSLTTSKMTMTAIRFGVINRVRNRAGVHVETANRRDETPLRKRIPPMVAHARVVADDATSLRQTTPNVQPPLLGLKRSASWLTQTWKTTKRRPPVVAEAAVEDAAANVAKPVWRTSDRVSYSPQHSCNCGECVADSLPLRPSCSAHFAEQLLFLGDGSQGTIFLSESRVLSE